MSLEIHMDDFWQDQLRKRSSYLGKIPSEGQVPNWFVRWMMRICFDCLWVKK